MNLPDTASGLIDELDRLVPERVPEVGESEIAIHRYAAKRELVLLLKHWREAAKRDPALRRSRR